jgi:hypothetical protein
VRYREIIRPPSLLEALANNPARLERAQAIGFDTSRVWYHGSTGRDIEAFDLTKLGANTGAKSATKGFFFASDPKVAASYGKHESYLPDTSRPYHDKYAAQVADMKAEMAALEPLMHYSDADSAKLNALFARLDRGPKKNRISYADYRAAEDAMEAKYHSSERQSAPMQHYELSKKVKDLEARMKAMQTMAAVSRAVVFPVYLKMQKPLIHDMHGEHYREVSYNDLLVSARRGRRDGAIIKNTFDPGYRGADAPMCDIAVVFSPQQVRSVYADFAPDKTDSANISD